MNKKSREKQGSIEYEKIKQDKYEYANFKIRTTAGGPVCTQKKNLKRNNPQTVVTEINCKEIF
ncbi:unnamed protein product [Meloidogyne enterolobii]|uniref:Uncharacterized protein n=1 Tax=Meloidogyne enterolobii TaxID=390850 RepID=A0ACB1AZN9_MELEN